MGQEPKKYHISDDGKVFRINEDGSFTEMGNIETAFTENDSIDSHPERHPHRDDYHRDDASTTNNRTSRLRWSYYTIAILCIVIVIGLLCTYYFNHTKGSYVQAKIEEKELTYSSEPNNEEPNNEEPVVTEEITAFPELTIFRMNISEDRAYTEVSFYPDGTCGFFYTIGFDSWSEMGHYRIDRDIIKADLPGGKSQSFRYHDGVCFMGDEILERVKADDSKHYFEYTTVFNGYDPDSGYLEKNDKYFTNGICVLNEDDTNQEYGTYYLQGGKIYITLDNGRQLNYYCLSERIYVVNGLEYESYILPNEK